MEVVRDRDLLHPHVVDEPVAHDRARRLLIWPHRGRQEELGVEVRALMKAQQLQRSRSDAQDPARYETGVSGEEAVLAPLVGADVAQPVTDDEGASVQDAEGPLRHWQAARQRWAMPPIDTCTRRLRRRLRHRNAGSPRLGNLAPRFAATG